MISAFENHAAYRLVNSKFPPISIFDDVARQDEFDDLYAVQSLTNPRLQNDVGQLNLVPEQERPYGIRGCSYALAPFVHLSPDGSRFSTGDRGVFYCADNINTAIAETRYHQERYFRGVANLKYDRVVMRALKATFTAKLENILSPEFIKLHDPDDYTHSQRYAEKLRKMGSEGIVYSSVRSIGNECYALFSPRLITDVYQTEHYEYVFDGDRISLVNKLAAVGS